MAFERNLIFQELGALGLHSNAEFGFATSKDYLMPEDKVSELRRKYASTLDKEYKSKNNYALTDIIFYSLHPELGGRDLFKPADSALIKEWYAISGQNKRNKTYNYLTDIIFFDLHPELGGRNPTKSEAGLVQEWKDIKAQIVIPYLEKRGSVIESDNRGIKLELQILENTLWRIDGKKRTKLPRKFGPHDFLHKGEKGKPAQDGKEGTAVELQSEEGGFVEFETPKWFHSWCELKERIQEAVEMVELINKSTVISDKDGVKTVKFPFDIKHLRRTRTSKDSLSSKEDEYLEVEIKDPTWEAKIQVSEAIELTQYESLLREHVGLKRAEFAIDHANSILNTANTANLPITELVNLLSFLQIIIFYIRCGQTISLINKEDASKRNPAKFAFRLMCRTSFSSIFRALLSSAEQDLFRQIVAKRLIIKDKDLKIDDTSPFFIHGYGKEEKNLKGPTVSNWLKSILGGKDELSYPKFRGSEAMGKFNVKAKTDKVRFEARGSITHGNPKGAMIKSASNWVDFAKTVFESASNNRNTGSSTDLKYNKSKCP